LSFLVGVLRASNIDGCSVSPVSRDHPLWLVIKVVSCRFTGIVGPVDHRFAKSSSSNELSRWQVREWPDSSLLQRPASEVVTAW